MSPNERVKGLGSHLLSKSGWNSLRSRHEPCFNENCAVPKRLQSPHRLLDDLALALTNNWITSPHFLLSGREIAPCENNLHGSPLEPSGSTRGWDYGQVDLGWPVTVRARMT